MSFVVLMMIIVDSATC